MQSTFFFELIGYAASVIVAVSLMMSAIVKLRIVNMIGSFTFAVYGLLIGSWPVIAMNGFIVCINIYYLLKIYRDKEYFLLLEQAEDSTYTRTFLEFYKDSITTYQPSYAFNEKRNFSLFVLRDMVPAGLVQGTVDEAGTLSIDLDFVIPQYRDFKVGQYLFMEKLAFFRSHGIQLIRTAAGSKTHNAYLEKTGFTRTDAKGPYPYALGL